MIDHKCVAALVAGDVLQSLLPLVNFLEDSDGKVCRDPLVRIGSSGIFQLSCASPVCKQVAVWNGAGL
jgi:hypothetical protein